MTWKYWIMHEWAEGVRFQCGELFVLPDEQSYEGQALWLTIDCVPKVRDDQNSWRWHLSEEEQIEWYETARAKLGDAQQCLIAEEDGLGDSDMLVAAASFTREEFIEWVLVWFREQGIRAHRLVSASLEDFTGRHEHANLLGELISEYATDSGDEGDQPSRSGVTQPPERRRPCPSGPRNKIPSGATSSPSCGPVTQRS
jgi:hypothetical protein